MKIPTVLIPLLKNFIGEPDVLDYTESRLFALKTRLGIAVKTTGFQRETRKDTQTQNNREITFQNVFRFPITQLLRLGTRNVTNGISETDLLPIIEPLEDEPFLRPDSILLRDCDDTVVSTVKFHAHELQAVISAVVAASGKEDVVIKFEFKNNYFNQVRFCIKNNDVEGYISPAISDDNDSASVAPEPLKAPISV